MPYIPSPMENFNKNNPFIILAKKEYDGILDDIQDFSKDSIKGFIMMLVSVTLLFIVGLLHLFLMNNTDTAIQIGLCMIGLLIVAAVLYRNLNKNLKWYLYNHPAMIEFDRLSKLEVNAILTLHNEDILQNLHGLYGLHGAIEVDIRHFLSYQRIYTAVSSTFVGVSIVSLIVNLI